MAPPALTNILLDSCFLGYYVKLSEREYIEKNLRLRTAICIFVVIKIKTPSEALFENLPYVFTEFCPFRI